MKELSTMLSFDHPNVMTLIGTCFDRDTPLIIMPFMSNGNVLEHVKQRREELLLPEGAPATQVKLHAKLFYQSGLLFTVPALSNDHYERFEFFLYYYNT